MKFSFNWSARENPKFINVLSYISLDLEFKKIKLLFYHTRIYYELMYSFAYILRKLFLFFV